MNTRIAPILLVPPTLLGPSMKEVVADTASGSAWVNRTLWYVSQTEVDGSTLVNLCHAVRVVEHPSPFLIEIVSTFAPCGLDAIQKVGTKQKSTHLGLVRNTQKLSTAIEKTFPTISILLPFSEK